MGREPRVESSPSPLTESQPPFGTQPEERGRLGELATGDDRPTLSFDEKLSGALYKLRLTGGPPTEDELKNAVVFLALLVDKQGKEIGQLRTALEPFARYARRRIDLFGTRSVHSFLLPQVVDGTSLIRKDWEAAMEATK